jgi:uncharacterized protein
MSLWNKWGSGVGLRPAHYPFVLENRPRVDWFEVVSENFIDTEGRPIHVLEKIRKDYPVALHGVSLSIGSTDPPNEDYIRNLKKLIDRIDPVFVSDHLCWTGVDGKNTHDLLPLPQTEEAIAHVVGRVQRVQEILERRFILENPSTYIRYSESEMPEWEFLSEVAQQADCGILLDVNNVFVNAFNHGFDPAKYLLSVPKDRVAYIHLAGHTDMGEFYFDTHDSEIIEPVWKLYEKATEIFGPVSSLVEWDAKIPEFQKLQSEADRARNIAKKYADA